MINFNETQDVCTLAHTVETKTATNRCCPHCGESYYMENNRRTTCVYYPPIWKDGVNINTDRNKSTVSCTCMNCGKDFSYTE